jgi:hypothetical protein
LVVWIKQARSHETACVCERTAGARATTETSNVAKTFILVFK